jgi:hypothetical protein
MDNGERDLHTTDQPWIPKRTWQPGYNETGEIDLWSETEPETKRLCTGDAPGTAWPMQEPSTTSISTLISSGTLQNDFDAIHPSSSMFSESSRDALWNGDLGVSLLNSCPFPHLSQDAFLEPNWLSPPLVSPLLPSTSPGVLGFGELTEQFRGDQELNLWSCYENFATSNSLRHPGSLSQQVAPIMSDSAWIASFDLPKSAQAWCQPTQLDADGLRIDFSSLDEGISLTASAQFLPHGPSLCGTFSPSTDTSGQLSDQHHEDRDSEIFAEIPSESRQTPRPEAGALRDQCGQSSPEKPPSDLLSLRQLELSESKESVDLQMPEAENTGRAKYDTCFGMASIVSSPAET